ncbi:MAG: Adaptive-response sensory-kinase SasA [Phycisphaerae bacterium]|nr:Adaptive-response sensory-kinase SasA [Phycisphaerae bacterium]
MSQIQPDATEAARKVEMIVAQLDSLPTLPRIVTQLLRMTRSDQTGARQVIELIKQDQALTAKILSLARRAGSGIRDDVTTIDRCVVLMGLEAVRNAAMSVKIFEIFNPADETGAGKFNLTGFWQHSLAVALACEQLAPGLAKSAAAGGQRPPSADDLFVAGLLHDIGKAALHYALPKSYSKVIEAAQKSHAPLPGIERRLIGIDHSVVGKRLAQKWNLPEGVAEAVWLHHTPPSALPESARARGFAPAVHLADLIVREMRLGFSGNFPRPASAEQVAESLGVPAAMLEPIRRQLPEQLAARASLIGIDKLDSRELYHNAIAGANEELARLNAQLLHRSVNLASKARQFDLLADLNRELRPAAAPIEVAELIAKLFAQVLECPRVAVFSEPPESPRPGCDPLIEGVVAQSDGRVVERFLLTPDGVDVAGLAEARRRGWFDTTQSPDGFGLYAVEGHLSWIHHRLSQPLPLAGARLMPLPAEGVWIGGVLFATEGEQAAASRWPAGRSELFALASAAALALRAAQLHARRENMLEELAAAAQRLAQAQDELTRQQAMASVGRMAAGAGHELNNPLTVICGRAELLSHDEADPKRKEALEQILAHAQRASSIVSELMSFARPPVARPDAVDAAALLRTLTAPLADADIDVRIQTETDPPLVLCDPEQMRQSLSAILENARQAMAQDAGGRHVNVRIAPVLLAEREMIEIAIADTGGGMSPEVLEHATDPFYSARPAGRGRGMGLALARRLIENNVGQIRLESEPGSGTVVYVRLPRAPEA